jgi:hypothetical protein
MNVAIQPCSYPIARKHYHDTVENPVQSDRIVNLLTPEQRLQYADACGDNVAVWGVTLGEKGRNRNKWLKLRPGDLAVFYRDKLFFALGRILLAVRNEQLAVELWDRYIYFLDDLQEIELPVSRYNAVLQYNAGNIARAFEVHEEPWSERLLELLELKIDEAYPQPTDTSTEALQVQLAALAETDAPTTTKARNEQGILRAFLFGKKTTEACDLCGRQFPISFLVAAHIKRRESCCDEERKSFDVIMKACKFGCDELFERGYIYVDAQGVIQPSPNFQKSTEDLKQAAVGLIGRPTPAYTESSAAHFKWHFDHLPRKLKTQ